MTNDKCLKWSIPSWIEKVIYKNKKGFADYIENEAIINCLLYAPEYKKRGFHFYRDIEIDPYIIHIMENGKNNHILNENMEDEYTEIL